DIKFERVQAVNTQQNVVFRLLNLLTVSFDTAGSKGQEGYLPAIRADDARALRDRIRRTPRETVEDEEAGEESGEDTRHVADNARTVLRLSAGDMVRIGLSSNRVFLFLVLLGPLSEYLERTLRDSAAERAVVEFF